MGLIQAVEYCADIYFGLLQRYQRMDRISISLILRGTGSLMALAATKIATRNLLLSLLAAALFRGCLFLIYDSKIALRGIDAAHGEASPRRTNQLALLRTALPLGFVLMTLSLSINDPRYFISDQLSTSALGIFAALASADLRRKHGVNSLGQTATPRLAKSFAAGDIPVFRQLTTRMLCLGAALGAGGVLLSLTLGHRILLILFRPEYAQHVGLLELLSGSAGVGFVGSMAGYAIAAARRFAELVPIQIAAVASAATAYFLVPRIGLTGAALATAIAGAVQVLGSLHVLRNVLRSRAAS